MLKIAWKNILRNKRRSLITASSIFFTVFLIILMRGYQLGVYLNLIDGVLHSYSGYIQIHGKGFWEDRSLDYTFSESEIHSWNLTKINHISSLIPRLESFALVSMAEKTKGIIVLGIDPAAERSFMKLDKKLIAGRYLTNDDNGILVSEGLANYLKVSVGDSLDAISQGYQGSSASGLFKIIGIVKLPAPEFNNQLIFMPLKLAQDFYSANGRITTLVLDIDNPKNMDHVISFANKHIDLKNFEVMSWREMMVELYQLYMSKQAGGVLVEFILYLIVGFGVFGTVLMMISERKYEFAVMMALGMRRIRLMYYFGTELVYICIVGLMTGLLVSISLVTYLHLNPIPVTGELAKTYASFGFEPKMVIAWQSDYIIQQVINTLIIVILTMIYPVYSILKINIPNALRH